MKGAIQMLKKMIDKYFDYEIVGEYLESIAPGIYQKKYIKKYHLKRR